jgi:hypothetical protein
VVQHLIHPGSPTARGEVYILHNELELANLSGSGRDYSTGDNSFIEIDTTYSTGAARAGVAPNATTIVATANTNEEKRTTIIADEDGVVMNMMRQRIPRCPA